MLVKRKAQIGNSHYDVEVPDACPICHRHSEVNLITADITNRGANVEVIVRCGYVGCRSFFICSYGKFPSGTLLSVRPIKPVLSQFPASVAQLSPMFISIFAEAEEAMHLGLKQIAGPGYRKAFEFLIKDYAKASVPEKAQEIEAKFSGVVVNEYVGDGRIQAVAKRCLWLGNDETHYLRKWTDHDVSDLVTLIKLTASWIEIEHLSKAYVQEMPGT